MAVFGIHTNAQNKSLDELIRVWKHAEDLGYGWISISDHLPGSLGPVSNEAVATQAALAACTSRVECGVLVYAIGLRHPAVLAAAAVTIDHLSNGRANIGIGSGSVPRDYEICGLPFPSPAARAEQLAEGARCVAALLRQERVDFEGEHFRVAGGSNGAGPVRDRIPLWVGTGGKRGLRIAAEHADGWNVMGVSPAAFAEKRSLLLGYCEEVGRDPGTITSSVNLPVLFDRDPSSLGEEQRAAALVGSVGEIVEQADAFAAAGADRINLFLPHPWPYDGLERLAHALDLMRGDD